MTMSRPPRGPETRRRLLGMLLTASGLLFLAAVLNPPILPHWGDDRSDTVGLASAHRAAWFTTVWLLSLAIVAAAAAAEVMADLLDSAPARIGRGLYLVGAALGLASTAYDLAATSTLHDPAAVPDWYLGVGHWTDGLGTAYFALLSPAAMILFAVAIRQTGTLPRWSAIVLIAAAVALLGQYTAFRGALPFPQFLAFLAIGTGLLARRRRKRKPSEPDAPSPHGTDEKSPRNRSTAPPRQPPH
jgi:hypothetical protein